MKAILLPGENVTDCERVPSLTSVNVKKFYSRTLLHLVHHSVMTMTKGLADFIWVRGRELGRCEITCLPFRVGGHHAYS